MKKEVIKIQSSEDERPFHLLVTRESTDKEGLEEVTVAFMMDQEQRAALIEHLANISDIEDVVGFTIAFGVQSEVDPDDPNVLDIFSRSIRGR
jgi:hypothetical protein